MGQITVVPVNGTTITPAFFSANLSSKGVLLEYNGVQAVYELPIKSSGKGVGSTAAVEGVLFVAHGCSHSATDWWAASASCPQCIGLPVEVNIVNTAVQRYNLAVIAISSYDREGSRCWSGVDTTRVVSMIAHFYRQILGVNPSKGRRAEDKGIVTLPPPLYLLGASSGGAFVGHLAQDPALAPPATAVTVQISSVFVQTASSSAVTMPPTTFVLMNKDEYTLAQVTRVIKGLSADQRPNFNIIRTQEKPILDNFFHDHSNKVISKQDSAKIRQALLEGGYIDASSSLLLQDPRSTDWRKVRV